MSFYYYTETIGSNNVVNNGGQTPWITTDQTSYRSSISPGSSESTGSNNVVSNGGQTPWITTGQTSYTSSISPGSCCTFNGGTVNISATPPGSFVGQILTCSYTDSRGVRTTYNGTVVVDDRERVNRTRTRGQVRSTSRTGIVSIPGHTDSTAITATDTITLTTTYNGCDIPLYMAPPGSTVGQRLIDGVVLRRPGKRIVFNGCTVVENPPQLEQRRQRQAQNSQQRAPSTSSFNSSGRRLGAYDSYSPAGDDIPPATYDYRGSTDDVAVDHTMPRPSDELGGIMRRTQR
uniref:Uncharacterized protein n=1 Tax=Moniliophthora roreri TaxID=221103 RepID=A0A0W0EVL0_MONRR